MNNGNPIDPPDILDTVYTRTIIEAAYNPKSIREISAEYEIPLSTAYRRVYTLCNCRLLQVHSSEIRGGRRCLLFKTKGEITKSESL